MSSRVTDESYVTLATNDNYVLGALALAHSLRSVQTTRQLTVLISSHVSAEMKAQLASAFDRVELVDLLNSNDAVNLALLKRPELGVTFTKLNCWRLEQYRKCVFLDADCLVLKNVDELFERDELSAVTDIGWPDCFNSGVFVYTPSLATYTSLANFANTTGSFDGGDQGLLNAYFDKWSSTDSRRLPFVYNMTTNASYSYAPAYKQFRGDVKIVHFIGAQKPWYFTFNVDSQTVVGNVSAAESENLNAWWRSFAQGVLPNLDAQTRSRLSTQLVHSGASSSGAQSASASSHGSGQWHQAADGQQHSNQQQQQQQQSQGSAPAAPVYVTGSVSSGGVVVGSDQHQNLWEKGQIEYVGRDSFSNIQAHLDAQLQKK